MLAAADRDGVPAVFPRGYRRSPPEGVRTAGSTPQSSGAAASAVADEATGWGLGVAIGIGIGIDGGTECDSDSDPDFDLDQTSPPTTRGASP